MLELAAAWGGCGAIGGAMVGLYRSGDRSRFLSEGDRVVQVLVCSAIGCVLGLLAFLAFTALLYDVEFFGNRRSQR